MTIGRLLSARLFLVAVGVFTWGYGQRTNDANIRLAGIGILAVALLLRFFPKRWLDDDDAK